MTYAYIRVSTESQTVENQRLVIREWAKKNHKRINRWVPETKSGTVKPEKRKLGEMLMQVQSGDVIIVTELSRLGRSVTMIFDILEDLLNRGIGVIAIKEGYELTNSLVAKVLAFAFGISAEIERQMISERTKAGLKRARLAGKQIGRLPGQKPTHYKLTGYENRIKRELRNGASINGLSIKYGVKWCTMRNFIITNNLRPKRKRSPRVTTEFDDRS